MPLVLADQLGLELAFTVAWEFDPQRSVFGQERLAALAIAVVGGRAGLSAPAG